MDGKSQSPDGIFAFISTLPYLNANELLVRTRALLIGFRMFPWLPVRLQPDFDASVHLRSKVEKFLGMRENENSFTYCSLSGPCKSNEPVWRKNSPKSSAVNVGRRFKFPSSTNELLLLLLYHWNSHSYITTKNSFTTSLELLSHIPGRRSD